MLTALLALALGCGDETDAGDADVGSASDIEPADSGTGDLEVDASPADSATVDEDALTDTTETGGDGGTQPTLEFDLEARGPFRVGYRAWDTEYVVEGTGETRTITVNVWYPTLDAEGEGEVVRYGGLFIDPKAWLDAEVAAPVGGVRYPVLLHSHGNRSAGGGSSMLMRWFASHGWVCVAPDHAGDMLVDGSREALLEHWVERPQDLRAALDAVAALDEEDPLSRADTSRVVLTGHSRGVYSTWAVGGATFDLDRIAAEWPALTEPLRARFAEGFRDERVVATVMLAGGYRDAWFGDDGYRTHAAPSLLLSGDADNPESTRRSVEQVDSLGLGWVELAEGCHETFGLNTCDRLAPAVSEPWVGAWALAFARHHLLGDDSAETTTLLTGERSLDAAITVHRPAPLRD